MDEIEKLNNSIQSLVIDSNQNKVNKGTGAGGANTNYYGKKFEDKTNNETRLLSLGYIKINYHSSKNTNKKNPKNDYYLSKKFEDKTIVFVLQNGLKTYVKYKYDIELFRCPDEAYIIEYNENPKIIIKILEKKEQNVPGSVETKLWASPSLKREYELVLGDKFKIYYGLCVNSYLENMFLSISTNKKYKILSTILNENDIDVLFGDNEDYFTKIDLWIKKD